MIPFMHLNVVHMIMLRKHFEVISSGTLLGIFGIHFVLVAILCDLFYGLKQRREVPGG